MQQMNNPYNDLKILCHPDKVSAILKGERTAPLYVRIKPTNICNQKCWYCVYANDAVIHNRSVDKRESIPWNKMKEIITDLSEMGTKAITFSGGGEPLCYQHICETLEAVREKKIEYAMITNGQALEKEQREALSSAKWLRISLDSVNHEMYQKMRGVNTFHKVLDNMEKFAKIKNKDCTLGVNFVVTNENYAHIFEMCKLLSDIGANNIKFSPLMVKEESFDYHIKIKETVGEQIQKAREAFESSEFVIIDKYTENESLNQYYTKKYKSCFIKEIFTVIGADCNVYYCHQRAYTEDGMIGDIKDQSFKEMWFSQATSERFKQMNPSQECNFCCAFDDRNILLDSLVKMDKQHINFI